MELSYDPNDFEMTVAENGTYTYTLEYSVTAAETGQTVDRKGNTESDSGPNPDSEGKGGVRDGRGRRAGRDRNAGSGSGHGRTSGSRQREYRQNRRVVGEDRRRNHMTEGQQHARRMRRRQCR